MITHEQLESIGFIQDKDLYVKHEFTTKYYLKMQGGISKYIIEVSDNRKIQYPIKANSLRDLVLLYEIISGSIIHYESKEYSNKMYVGAILIALSVIALFLIFYLLTI